MTHAELKALVISLLLSGSDNPVSHAAYHQSRISDMGKLADTIIREASKAQS